MTVLERMSIHTRFFGKRDDDQRKVALGLLCDGPLRLDAEAITQTLRAFHPSMANATCEIDAGTQAQGTPIGLVRWGEHVISFLGFDTPMPAPVVERCLQPAHFGQELKARARAHASHVLMYYTGNEKDVHGQYVALAAAAGVLSVHGAIVVVNETGHTAFPCSALREIQGDRLELLEEMPLLMLYAGFVKFDVEGLGGTWMRTFGNPVLGLPDFAMLTKGHHEGQATFDRFENLLSYLRASGATFAPGHTMQIGEGQFLKVRAPEEHEYFLESEGQMLVLETISKDEINRPGRE
jgi:Domain of unknown function (DUF4261)